MGKYGTLGVCHQACNRICWGVGIDCRGAKGYNITSLAYGPLGRNGKLWEAWAGIAKLQDDMSGLDKISFPKFPRLPRLPKWFVESEGDYDDSGSDVFDRELPFVDDAQPEKLTLRQYLKLNPDMKQYEFDALDLEDSFQDSVATPIKSDEMDGIKNLQVELHRYRDNLLAGLMAGEVSQDKYFAELSRFLLITIGSIEGVVGEDRTVQIFGEDPFDLSGLFPAQDA